MATCKGCLHFEVCAHRYEKLCKGTKIQDLNHACTKFKDRNEYAEVVHGRWEDLRESSKDVPQSGCSVCGRVIIGLESEYNYCPNCGARMDRNIRGG